MNIPELRPGEHYAGISRDPETGEWHHLVLLPATTEKDLTWQEAIDWATSVGGELPTRFEAALLYANLRDKLDTDHWHWTGTQHANEPAWAWDQTFGIGNQFYSRKGVHYRARAVRRVPCQVALDPAVSSDARALIAQERERAEKAEAEVARLKDEREGNTRQFRRLQDRLAQSEADASSLAAGQCIVTNGGLMGDDHGHLYCDMQRQRDELRGRIRVMADIMSSALDVMKTVEGDGSEEDEALMNIRAKMASAIDYVARRDYPKESK